MNKLAWCISTMVVHMNQTQVGYLNHLHTCSHFIII